MILADHPDGVRCITQPDHAALAGLLAERWGAGEFAAPGVPGSAILAAYEHDAGWWRWDLRPRRSDAGELLGFLDVSADQWIRFYDRGIDAVADADAYAGLLCSLHGAGVRRQRYGTHAAIPDRSAAYADFIASEETRQLALAESLRREPASGVTAETVAFLEALHADGVAPDAADGGPVWYDYRLLQAWDRLSLYLCTAFDYESAGVGPVPRAPDGGTTALELTPVDDDTIRVAPYPFETAPLGIHVRGRVVPDSALSDERDLLEAYYRRGARRFEFTLVR